MSRPATLGIATIVDAICVTAILYVVSGGHLSPVWFVAPLLFAALAFFMANMYFNIFEDLDETETHDNVTFAGHPNHVNRPKE